MQIHPLLRKTHNLVRDYSLKSPVKFSYQSKIDIGDITQKLVVLEERFSWQELISLFQNINLLETDQEAGLRPFLNFLTARWQRIKDIYQLTYPFKYKSELTKVCMTLATELAVMEYGGRKFHHLELLMPTIDSVDEALLTNLIDADLAVEEEHIQKAINVEKRRLNLRAETKLNAVDLAVAVAKGRAAAEPEKLQLHHFILDHWGKVINIQDCIKNAKGEGVLVHPSALQTVIDQFGRIPGFDVILLDSTAPELVPGRGRLQLKIHEGFISYWVHGMSAADAITIDDFQNNNFSSFSNLFTPQELINLNEQDPLRALQKLASDRAYRKIDSLQADILLIAAQRRHVILPAKPRSLTRQEALRIIFHSREAKESYDTVCKVADENAKSYNAKEAMLHLAAALRQGGMRGGQDGTDQLAGYTSYFGVRKFYDFTQTITYSDFDAVLDARLYYQDHQKRFGVLWFELLASAIERPECHFSEEEKVDIQNLIISHFEDIAERLPNRRPLPILCSEEFARVIEDIVRYNTFLQTIKPIVGRKIKYRIALFEESREKKLKELESAILNNKLTHYTNSDRYTNYPEEARQAADDTISLRSFSRMLISSVDNFTKLLVSLPYEYHAHIFFHLLNDYSIVPLPEASSSRAATRAKNKFYVCYNRNALEYSVVNPKGEVITGRIERRELDLQISRHFDLNQLTEFLPRIFQITSKRGHTFLNPEFLQNLLPDAKAVITVIKATAGHSSYSLNSTDAILSLLGKEFLQRIFHQDADKRELEQLASLKVYRIYFPYNTSPKKVTLGFINPSIKRDSPDDESLEKNKRRRLEPEKEEYSELSMRCEENWDEILPLVSARSMSKG